jgi:hypothetical protein
MMFRAVFSSLMMEAVRTSETSVDNHFTRQYNPEDSSEHHSESCAVPGFDTITTNFKQFTNLYPLAIIFFNNANTLTLHFHHFDGGGSIFL